LCVINRSTMIVNVIRTFSILCATLWSWTKSFQHHSTIYCDFINKPASSILVSGFFAASYITDKTTFSNFLEASLELNSRCLVLFPPLLTKSKHKRIFLGEVGCYSLQESYRLLALFSRLLFPLRTPIVYFYLIFAP
jgi:hypothetical protein